MWVFFTYHFHIINFGEAPNVQIDNNKGCRI